MAILFSYWVMRVIKLLLWLFIIQHSLTAQTAALDFSKKITLDGQDQRIDILIKQISKKSGATFSFDTKKIDVTKTLTLKSEITLQKFLGLLEKVLDVNSIILDNHIVLLAKRTEGAQQSELTESSGSQTIKKKPPAQNEKSTSFTSEVSHKIIDDDSVKIQRDTSKLPEPLFVPEFVNERDSSDTKSLVNDSTIHKLSDQDLEHKESLLDSQQVFAKEQMKDTTRAKRNQKSMPFFIKAGGVVNEAMYAGAVIQIGFPFLYATLGGSTNFDVIELRYGGGSSFKLDTTWQLHLQVNIGNTTKTFHQGDSISMAAIKVRGRLGRICALFEKMITEKITLQFGPTLNRLKTEYSVGDSTEIGSLGPHPERLYRTFKAPYFFDSPYKNDSYSNVKFWIGIQIGILYKFNVSRRRKNSS